MSAVVESSGWPGYSAKGANGARFAPPIHDGAGLLVPTICLYEVFKRVCHQRGQEDALQAVTLMMTGAVIDLSPEIALPAAQLSIDHKLPLANSIILATASLHDCEVWTQDEHLKGLERVIYLEKTK